MICMKAFQIVTMDTGMQRAWPALWHTSGNSCSAHPSTTTTTHHYYYYHHQGRGWRNRCLALLPAQRVTWQRSLVKACYHLPAPGCENHNILFSPCHRAPPPPPFLNILQHENTMKCNLQMFLVRAGFINQQQTPAEILISSRLMCIEVSIRKGF